MRAIGIDPGYGRMGVAVVEQSGGKETCVFSTCLLTDTNLSLPERLGILGTELEALIDTWKPEKLALETLFFNNNQKTALQVAEVRGMVTYIGMKKNCHISEYSPQAVKLAVTGYGKSEKSQVEAMLKRLICGIREKALDDEYDAIAIALTCIVSKT